MNSPLKNNTIVVIENIHNALKWLINDSHKIWEALGEVTDNPTQTALWSS